MFDPVAHKRMRDFRDAQDIPVLIRNVAQYAVERAPEETLACLQRCLDELNALMAHPKQGA